MIMTSGTREAMRWCAAEGLGLGVQVDVGGVAG
jgi:hypothetical protein